MNDKANLSHEMTVTAAGVAAMIQRSVRFVRDLHRENKMPKPLEISSPTALLWSRETIEKWVAAGTPTPEEYERDYGDRHG